VEEMKKDEGVNGMGAVFNSDTDTMDVDKREQEGNVSET
jgi:hypothetical protein